MAEARPGGVTALSVFVVAACGLAAAGLWRGGRWGSARQAPTINP